MIFTITAELFLLKLIRALFLLLQGWQAPRQAYDQKTKRKGDLEIVICACPEQRVTGFCRGSAFGSPTLRPGRYIGPT